MLEGYGAIANVPSWPINQPCPYYGYIVGITATADIISEISKDSRFFLICNPINKNEIPNEKWLLSLRIWMTSHGMSENEASMLMQSISALTKKEIVEVLITVLSNPKN
jgi:hypothetical protein